LNNKNFFTLPTVPFWADYFFSKERGPAGVHAAQQLLICGLEQNASSPEENKFNKRLF